MLREVLIDQIWKSPNICSEFHPKRCKRSKQRFRWTSAKRYSQMIRKYHKNF